MSTLYPFIFFKLFVQIVCKHGSMEISARILFWETRLTRRRESKRMRSCDSLNSFELIANWQQCVIVREIDRSIEQGEPDTLRSLFRVIIALKLSRLREYRKIDWLIVQPREARHTLWTNRPSRSFRIAKQRARRSFKARPFSIIESSWRISRISNCQRGWKCFFFLSRERSKSKEIVDLFQLRRWDCSTFTKKTLTKKKWFLN